MPRISGIKYHKTLTGKVKSVTIDLNRWGTHLEDFFDLVEAHQRRDQPSINLDKVIKKLDRKHGIK